jgi:RimJ/RimL family protein N-acetyltransferase
MMPGTRVGPLLAERALPAGRFALRPVDPEADLDLVHGWMNDPDTARYWELDGPAERTAQHLAGQSEADYSAAFLGLLDGEPMSYWELYRADLDPLLAGRYPAAAHDAGVHLLIGPPELRGRGLGTALLREVAARALSADPYATRMIAEPDVRNAASIAAFEHAGFRRAGDVELADKTAVLMIKLRAPMPGPPAFRGTTARPAPPTVRTH